MTKDRPKVLIVDDEPGARRTLSDILRAKGYEPVTAGSGAEALAQSGGSPDVVLLDLRLPDIPGIEVLKRVKAASPSTEVIILTGHATLGSAIEAANTGAFSYLQKPYEVEELLLHVRNALEKKRAAEELVAEKEMFENIVRGIGAGLSLLDSEARLIWANDILQEWLGPIERLKGQPCHRIYNMKDPERECAVHRVLRSGRIEQGEVFVYDGEGGRRYFQLTAAPVKDRTGRIVQIVELTQDVTERKMMEENLKRKLDELERLNRLMVGRELRMEELRREVQELKQRIEELEARQTEQTKQTG